MSEDEKQRRMSHARVMAQAESNLRNIGYLIETADRLANMKVEDPEDARTLASLSKNLQLAAEYKAAWGVYNV